VQQLLLQAQIVIIVALAEGRGVQRNRRRRGGARELADGCRGDELERRWYEIARVAAVHGGAGAELPHEIDARLPQAAACIRAVGIEAPSVFERERCPYLPLVLQVPALDLLR